MNDNYRFSRLELLIGADAVAGLAGSSVAVFGVGGVGSYAVEALARGGVGRLTLIDYDKVVPSNINRQLHALEGSIGHPKVQLMAERCRAINPDIAVEPLQACYQAETSAELLDCGYDYVLDCIDTISAKIHLIASCRERGLPIIAAMGAANKRDPAKVAVADLFTSQKCRLARIIRKELRRRGIRDGVKVVYSTEEYRPLPGSTPGQSDGRGTPEHVPLTLGSCSYLPPIFGLTMAGEVLRTLQGDRAGE